KEPVILHWLGEMFDPALKGYWGHADHVAAMDVCIDIIADHAAKVDGIKLSLLDKDKEIRLRRKLPQGVRCYTGDDFNYAELIHGDEQGFSHALLGIFDVIAPAASAALAAHARGDLDSYWKIFAPTVPLSRHIFKAPTQFYKTGVVPRLSQRPPEAFRHGRRPAERALAAASDRGVQARRRRRPHPRSRSCRVAPDGCDAHLRRGGLIMAPRVVTAEQFASLVADGDTLLIGGSGAGHSVPDTLIGAIGKRFKAEGRPRNLTAVHPVGLGDRGERGIGHLAHAGLLKRVV